MCLTQVFTTSSYPNCAYFIVPNGLPGVNNQIHDDLLNLCRICLDAGEFFLEVHLQVNQSRYRRTQQGDEISRCRIKVDRLDHEGSLSGVSEQLACQIRGALCGIDD